jgi:plastocyanin
VAGLLSRPANTVAVLGAALLALVTPAAGAVADPPIPEPGFAGPLSAQVQHLHFKYGPIAIAPGQNLILVGPVTVEKPASDGYVVGFRPNLIRADGSVPPIEQIHLHHAVWVNLSRRDSTAPGLPERIAAAGEEKTYVKLPKPYGYPVRASDSWALNYMIHNETANPDTVWVTYDVDFVPASSPLARHMVPVRPIWMDVQNGKAYPVFDVHRGSGKRGRFTYPDQSPRARRVNTWKVNRRGTLIWVAGHLHPGGLWDDLRISRGRRSRLLFRSKAHYWDPNGPVSWDMAMTASRPRWKVAVRKGDRLRISTAYETRQASWYESMGIMFAFMAPPQGNAINPFRHPKRVPTTGKITHGHLPEASNHGGGSTGLPDPSTLPDGQTLNKSIGVAAFRYLPGDLSWSGPLQQPPVFRQGQQIQFGNLDASNSVYHTITACRDPCTGSTGISYPLANGGVDFDSGELGYGPSAITPAANRANWFAPTNLKPGTYAYFCRIHPFMRGAFRIAR